jgi:hypothetical protein
MASAAATSAFGTQVLAVQRLYYNITPNPTSSIFLLFSSQLLGYGLGGLMRSEFILLFPIKCRYDACVLPAATLLYPTKMLYPVVLPLVSVLDALYKTKVDPDKKLRLFYIMFFA